ncbi:MAG: hypothetical protein RIR00_1829 [Pseudomonadota bacterium]
MNEQTVDGLPVPGGDSAPEISPVSIAPLPVGQQLRQAREARGFTLTHIAAQLKLGEKQLQALESGDWHLLPGATFIRGFVRNYARLVQLDPEPLMQQLNSVLNAAVARIELPAAISGNIPSSHHGGLRQRDLLAVLFGLLILALATAAYFFVPEDLFSRISLPSWLEMREEVPAPKAAEPAFPPGVPPGTTPVVPPETAPAPAANEAPAAPAPLAPPAVEAPAAAQSGMSAQPAPIPVVSVPVAPTADKSADRQSLRLVYVGESWVEVRDRTGTVLHSQRSFAGNEQRISGQLPYSVVVGNAKAVKVYFRDQLIDVSPYVRGDVARFNLE